ncbi:MAG: hypothetical protein MZV64_05075 [Ignavibacteriales bacterium]|nr:hypothetical protein [Ignavibacteriales bacterium]
MKASSPTDLGELQAQFEFELFGTGVDAGPDDVPPAPRLGRARASSARARPGARSWTRTCSRTRSSTGARTGMVFFRNVQVRWMPIKGDTTLDARPRAAGRERRRRACYADRIELAGRQGPLPAARPLRRSSVRPEVGLRPASAGIAAADQVGRHARRPVRPQRRAPRAGASTSAPT